MENYYRKSSSLVQMRSCRWFELMNLNERYLFMPIFLSLSYVMKLFPNIGFIYIIWSRKRSMWLAYRFKVQLFWEGRKNLRHPPYGFEIYLLNVKTIRRMAQIFVAFSEKLNFNNKLRPKFKFQIRCSFNAFLILFLLYQKCKSVLRLIPYNFKYLCRSLGCYLFSWIASQFWNRGVITKNFRWDKANGWA